MGQKIGKDGVGVEVDIQRKCEAKEGKIEYG
jgi:hypothetical protein